MYLCKIWKKVGLQVATIVYSFKTRNYIHIQKLMLLQDYKTLKLWADL